MRKLLPFLLLLPMAVPALASDSEDDILAAFKTKRLASGGHFAVRALCAPNNDYTGLNVFPLAYSPPNWFATATDCVNGRIGADFDLPVTPTGAPILTDVQVVTTHTTYDPQIVIERDCAEGKQTKCNATSVLGGNATTLYGKITWPGDQDWFIIGFSTGREYNLTTRTAPTNCFVAASVINDNDGTWIRVAGGPAGCAYEITIGGRE